MKSTRSAYPAFKSGVATFVIAQGYYMSYYENLFYDLFFDSGSGK